MDINKEYQIYEAKNLAYYEHLLQAWLTTRMEHDKSLLFISTGAIGLLITLLTTVGLSSIGYAVLFLLSCLSFLTTTLILVLTFSVNASYIKFILAGYTQSADIEDKKLKIFRKITQISFIMGIVLALLVGIMATFQRLQ